jgi:23S rRNA (guanosine2251-2'-O)-methyltransferase
VELRIPMAGDVESLNVASAAAALSFELLRRRLGEHSE